MMRGPTTHEPPAELSAVPVSQGTLVGPLSYAHLWPPAQQRDTNYLHYGYRLYLHHFSFSCSGLNRQERKQD